MRSHRKTTINVGSRTRGKREQWDERFIALARHIGSWSKDRSTQVGCVIVTPDRTIASAGFNGFPRGVDDDVEARHSRPAKYSWTEHAERNAIYNAARNGVALRACTMYLPWFPCMDCARAIVQSGLAVLVCERPNFDHPKWGADFRLATQLFKEARVLVRYVKPLERDARPI